MLYWQENKDGLGIVNGLRLQTHLSFFDMSCLNICLFFSLQMRTDAEKRSLVESGLSWDSDDNKPGRKSQGRSAYDTGSLKSESASKWKKTRPQGDGMEGGKGELRKPQTLGQGNVLKKARNPPVGVTSPITHTSQSGLRVAGEW